MDGDRDKKTAKTKVKKKKYEDMTKEEKIKERTRILKSQFSNLDTKTKKIVDSLINNAAFMTVTLEYLQLDILEHGVTAYYQNGENQWGKKNSPEAATYNTMIKNLSSITKQLCDLLPKNTVVDNDDGFDDFVKERQ